MGINQQGPVRVETAYAAIRRSDRHLLKAALKKATHPDGDGIYDAEFTVEASDTLKERILHARGKTFFNEKGTAVKIAGTIQDVTAQRKVELTLQQQVNDRTAALRAANEEMTAINEEYLSTNEELAQTNKQLNSSNQNLQQFAYVASHDLQEPLRKIQAFGDLLRKRYGQQLGPGSDYADRMQTAAARMAALIKDLLSFSRFSSGQPEAKTVVPLGELVRNVLTDLELVIEQSGAVIHIDKLPAIKGDPLQLRRIFGQASQEFTNWFSARGRASQPIPFRLRSMRCQRLSRMKLFA